MKYLLPSQIKGRSGFTLIEMAVASTLMAIVMGLAFQAFIDSNKAKSTAIASGVLKTAGQIAITEIYKSLHQSRHIFDRNAVTNTFIGRLPIVGCNIGGTAVCSPGVTLGDLQLPQIELTGSFMSQDASGAVNPNFVPTSVGNALMIATVEPKAILTQGASGTDLLLAFGTTSFNISAYRIHFYFLTRRILATGIHYRGTSNYQYQLMHWKSKPYLDYSETKAFMKRVMTATGATTGPTFIDAKFTSLSPAYAGALNLGASDATMTTSPNAVFKLNAISSSSDLAPNLTTLLLTDRYDATTRFDMKSSFGDAMTCFNTWPATSPTAIPAFYANSVMSPGVPAYADQNTSVPYGFETMIAGPPDGRQVLVRLTLAAVTNPGKTSVGEAFQQVVQVYDY
jgi:prepilin-type N-terminal cleavage/methylation domain-containing protein